MSRPLKSSDQKRCVTARVRLTKDEKKTLGKLAGDASLSVSDFLRVRALQAIPYTRKASPERAALLKGFAEIRKIGSNVNQIARALNRRSEPESELGVAPKMIEYVLAQLDELTRGLLKELDHGH